MATRARKASTFPARLLVRAAWQTTPTLRPCASARISSPEARRLADDADARRALEEFLATIHAAERVAELVLFVTGEERAVGRYVAVAIGDGDGPPRWRGPIDRLQLLAGG